MRCPYCGSMDDKVLESRTMANGESIRRRRECISCGYRFTSYEHIEEKPFMVVKRDGRRQPFDRSKLEKGIQRALEKRSVATSTIDKLIDYVFNTPSDPGRSVECVAQRCDLIKKNLDFLEKNK